ncbi:molybdopterin-binding protein [Paraclostridium sordellii]|uniref:molybdopterin-binding protein n=1 Tax=Paraclostridium sordellii TaxID=1505 RepID=UPI0005E78E2B|nr:molybdopterin-binding protein [Paeniclostridium sordellii]CEO09621.1 molybdopterin cofactor biosynthesis protein [[Clostridium] sordellii] [Paeniclostridium sordellii]CEP87598.1 molybdopterin cofactor biosynthesis protein [[Clostridium] sordellii] [Paeniclostridium sordellii]CEP95934.1 molybdopterin cofactor biosynthesis protein [[Clostridium] sordellii] [Paeniclostridium sordellii]CEP98722.1 molybdopterin cofactor biosynthesis protein [[Clostridium] sordellii] [Paeniclostridium sordellii]
MKKIKTVDAVGHVLCHDITQIIPGKFKGRAFKKGHVVKEEDIEKLLSLGKDNLYVFEKEEGMVHENDGAIFLKNITAGKNLEFSEIKEGKIDFIANCDGLLKINVDKLFELNCIDDIMMATLHNNYIVHKGLKVAGTRVIPLMVEQEKLDKAKLVIGEEKIINVIPFKKKKVGIVTTGNEVYHKRIVDKFGPVMIEKMKNYDCEILGQIICPDDTEIIKNAIQDFLDKGAELILCTGGMSVDPDDLTPAAIKQTGADIITYGSPILPGAMFLLAYNKGVPIMGIPGCAMYSKTTVLDVVLPRILIDEKFTKADIARYGHGGLCMNCEICTYPACNFAK